MDTSIFFLLAGLAGVITSQRQSPKPYIEVSINYLYSSREYQSHETPPIHNLKITVWNDRSTRGNDSMEFHEEPDARRKHELVFGPGSPLPNGVNDQQKTYIYKQEYLQSSSKVKTIIDDIRNVKQDIENGRYSNRPNAGLLILKDVLPHFSPRSNQTIHEGLDEYFMKLR